MWSPNIAYAVGLITTDGNLSPDKRHMEFTSTDLELIDLLKECLSLTNKIGYKKCGYSKNLCPRIQFGNVKLYRWLTQIGLTPNKSKTLGSLKIPKRYMSDFLRGCIDGDGCIRVYQDRKYTNSTRLYTIFGSGSLRHIEWLQKKITSLYGINGNIQKSTRIWQLVYAKRASIILLNKIYYSKSIPCLERKMDKVKQYLKS